MAQRTCLVVDDSLVVRKAARRIIEGFGFAVREAKDGQEALEACRTELPDGVLRIDPAGAKAASVPVRFS